MRTRLAGQGAADVRANSATIWERLSVLVEFAIAPRLLVYVSTGNEVDTQGLIRQLLAMGRQVCVPRFETATQGYTASELHDFDAELTTGKFGILEPKPGAVRPAALDQIDAVLVPGVGVRRNGKPIGPRVGSFRPPAAPHQRCQDRAGFRFPGIGRGPGGSARRPHGLYCDRNTSGQPQG